ESGRLNRELSKIYRNKHREIGGFESQYLQNIALDELVNSLMANEKEHSASTLNLVTAQFLDYKKQQTEAIHLKDLSRFNKYAVPLIRYVKQLDGLNLNEKKALLANFDLGIQDHDQGFTVYNQAYSKMSLIQKGNFRLVTSKGQDGPNLSVGSLTYSEKKILRFLAEKQFAHINRPKEILSMGYKTKGLEGLIDSKSLNYLDSQVNKSYRDIFVQFLAENRDRIGIEAALEYGLLVEPLKQEQGRWTYAVRAHRCARSSSISAGRELTEFFNHLGYDKAMHDQLMKRWNSNSNTLSLNHSLVNELNRMEVTGDHSGLVRMVERTAVYKPALIHALKVANGTVNKPLNLNNISILQLRDTFAKLLKDQQTAKSLKFPYPEPGNGLFGTLPRVDDFAGYLSSFEDNEEEQRRKKLLRKFYADLEH
ncbi:hypothetical protein LCGC14_1823820, partial [marine sediment metagenome]